MLLKGSFKGVGFGVCFFLFRGVLGFSNGFRVYGSVKLFICYSVLQDSRGLQFWVAMMGLTRT